MDRNEPTVYLDSYNGIMVYRLWIIFWVGGIYEYFYIDLVLLKLYKENTGRRTKVNIFFFSDILNHKNP